MAAGTRAALRDVGRLPVYRRATWGRMASLATEPPAFDPAPFALVATPGHAPDHHAVWDAARATLYGGDLFLGVRVRIAHAHEDPRLLARSLRAAAALRPARLFDAHRGLVPDPVARLEAKAAWVEDTIARIEALVDRGWTDARVRQAVLGREEWTGVVSRGEYSRGNWVRAVRAGYASMPNSRVASAS
jgi:glyoxylase-like metal-dependent hydrolase (beta-lactamase superfamily II)